MVVFELDRGDILLKMLLVQCMDTSRDFRQKISTDDSAEQFFNDWSELDVCGAKGNFKNQIAFTTQLSCDRLSVGFINESNHIPSIAHFQDLAMTIDLGTKPFMPVGMFVQLINDPLLECANLFFLIRVGNKQ